MERPPIDLADHAEDFARRYERELDQCCALRMQELGIPRHRFGAPDFGGDGRWRAFIASGRSGGSITTGITANSGILNPRLSEAKGSRLWAKARLRDRLDAVIAHEFEEEHLSAIRRTHRSSLPRVDRSGSHNVALDSHQRGRRITR